MIKHLCLALAFICLAAFADPSTAQSSHVEAPRLESADCNLEKAKGCSSKTSDTAPASVDRPMRGQNSLAQTARKSSSSDRSGNAPAILTTVLWTAGAAVFAAILTAFISRATKISEFRQAWINELRSDVATYLGQSRDWYEALCRITALLPSQGKTQAFIEELLPLESKARVLLWRIKFRFNPNPNPNSIEDDDFLRILESLIDQKSWIDVTDRSKWETISNDAVVRGRKILKREWEVTKTRIFV